VRHEPTNPDEGLARAGAADRQGVPLLGGEQPVGCALLCRKSLRQRLAAPLFFGLGLGDTADKASDRQACRDAHPRWFTSSPSWPWQRKSGDDRVPPTLVVPSGNPGIPPAGVSLLASGIPPPLCPAYASATARRAPMDSAAS
jgi:hypothetical protein